MNIDANINSFWKIPEIQDVLAIRKKEENELAITHESVKASLFKKYKLLKLFSLEFAIPSEIIHNLFTTHLEVEIISRYETFLKNEKAAADYLQKISDTDKKMRELMRVNV